DQLGHIKRNTEAQAAIIYAGGVKPANETDDKPAAAQGEEPAPVRGVRPRGDPAARQPAQVEIAESRRLPHQTLDLLTDIQDNEAATARIGVSTWRNLKSRVIDSHAMMEQWFSTGDEAAHRQAARASWTIHELIESTEGRILDSAKVAVGFGER